MNVKVITIAVLVNIAKTSSATVPVNNVERVLYVMESSIIVHSASVLKHTLVHHLLNVDQNAMAMSIVHLLNQLASMEFVRIFVKALVASTPIAI